MAGEGRLEPVGEHEPERLRERDDGRRRGRERGRELLLTLALPLPVPVEAAGASPSRFAPRRGRRRRRRRGRAASSAPSASRSRRRRRPTHRSRAAPHRGSRLRRRSRRPRPPRRRRAGARDRRRRRWTSRSGRGTRCGRHSRRAPRGDRPAPGTRPRRYVSGINLAPERARHRLPALAELALRDGENALARREQVHDRGLERTGPRGGEDEHLALRPEHRAKPFLGEREHLGEVRRAVMEDGPRERAQHLGRHRGRPGRQELLRARSHAVSVQRLPPTPTHNHPTHNHPQGHSRVPDVTLPAVVQQTCDGFVPTSSRPSAVCRERDRLLERRLVRAAHRAREDARREDDPLLRRVGTPRRRVGTLRRRELGGRFVD